MFKGIFLYLIGGILIILGVIGLIDGAMDAITEYTKFVDNLGGAMGVFLFPALWTAIKFAGAYGCYIYGKEAIEEFKDNKQGYDGPSFKDIGK